MEKVKVDMMKAKTSFWSALLFYLLIAFEFAYMAGPFAAYFYSIYSPALSFFNTSPIFSWLVRFFLPHIVQNTSSLFVDLHNFIGMFIAIVGFVTFCAGAIKIYLSKLRKKGAVTGGLYKYIRHPQYLAFIVCSFGLLLMWPRYLVVVSFVTMLFVYYFLARAEERECLAKFGDSYAEYMGKTYMFVPIRLPRRIGALKPSTRAGRILAGIGAYALVLAAAIGLTMLVNTISINSLYATYTDNAANISLCEMEPDTIQSIVTLVESDPEVAKYVEDFPADSLYLNYILPTVWFSAEVPMNGIVYRAGHRSNPNYDRNAYKVILTKVSLQAGGAESGRDILYNLSSRLPIVEVWVDLQENKITKILDIPEDYKYKGIPVAVY